MWLSRVVMDRGNIPDSSARHVLTSRTRTVIRIIDSEHTHLSGFGLRSRGVLLPQHSHRVPVALGHLSLCVCVCEPDPPTLSRDSLNTNSDTRSSSRQSAWTHSYFCGEYCSIYYKCGVFNTLIHHVCVDKWTALMSISSLKLQWTKDRLKNMLVFLTSQTTL